LLDFLNFSKFLINQPC